MANYFLRLIWHNPVMKEVLTLAARMTSHNIFQSWRWLILAFLAVYLIWNGHWIFFGESVSAFHFQPPSTIFPGIFVAQGIFVIYGFWSRTRKTPRLPILTAESLRDEGIQPSTIFNAGTIVLWGWLLLCGALALAVASYHAEIRLNYEPYYSVSERSTLTAIADTFAGAALVPDPEHGLVRGGTVVIPRGQIYFAIASLFGSFLMVLWVQFVTFRIRNKLDWVSALIIVAPAFLLEMTSLFTAGDGMLIYRLIRDWQWYWSGALVISAVVHHLCRAKFIQQMTTEPESLVSAPAVPG